jgi:SAM-dependent methyltransferase
MPADARSERAWPGRLRRWGPLVGHSNERPRNRLLYLQLDAALAHAAREYARGRLVDMGCGTKPWRARFAPYVSEHVGVDHADSLHGLEGADLVAGAYDVPLPDGWADTLLMTEVLEHLERPADALAEMRRLLSPGGALILTTPFTWPLHEEPRDFFRYSPHGVRHLLGEAGLDVLELHPLSGSWGTLALHASFLLDRRWRLRPAQRAVPALSVALQRAALALDARDERFDLSWNHLVVARRRG